jgi:hypothetical protein
MIIKDIDGNPANDIVYVTVVDLTPPAIEELDDYTYVVDTTGNTLVWTANDRNPNSYEVYRNDSLIISLGWDGNPITIDIDGLGLGIYNYTIRVIDIDDNFATDTVWVSVVVDETPPTIDDPPDTYYQVGTPGHNLTWTPEDEFPDHYEIFRNGTSIEEDYWHSDDENITISIDDLPEGVYNFTIIVYDDGGNNVTHTIWVEVVDDTTAPTIDSPNDVSYNEGIAGNEIVWTPSDDYPLNYTIFRDGFEIESGDWNGSAIAISIDGLAAGEYNYTITVFDVGSNQVSDTVLVTVLDVTSPEIDSPDDIEFAEGSVGNTIQWTPTDLHPAFYTILRNGTEIESDDWTGDSILISLDDLTLGVWNITIIAWDESDNNAKDTVMVTIYDGTPPTINNPGDLEYEEGDTGNTITWTPSDLHPASYSVYVDGELQYSDNWNGSPIEIIVDGLPVGNYNFTIIVEDIAGNTVIDTVMVSVLSSTTTPTTTTTTTSTTTGPTNITTTTTPIDGAGIIIVIAIAGAGGVILIIVAYTCKKRKG